MTHSRYSEETALSDEEIGYFLQCELLFVLKEQMKTRIHVTAFECPSSAPPVASIHRCVHASAIPGRSRAAPIAKMRRDELGLFKWFTYPLGSLKPDKMMARPVKSITADPILFVIFVRNRVMKRMSGECLVEGGMEKVRRQFVYPAPREGCAAALNPPDPRCVVSPCR